MMLLLLSLVPFLLLLLLLGCSVVHQIGSKVAGNGVKDGVDTCLLFLSRSFASTWLMQRELRWVGSGKNIPLHAE